MLYIQHREANVTVLGPGRRYVIWLQGCKKHCAGCVNPEGRALDRNGYYISAESIFAEIKGVPSLTGVTISGGEPFLQGAEIAQLIKLLRECTELDIMVYSGYTLQELRGWQDANVDYILANIDILVDGEYIESMNDNQLYRGSGNQVIHFLSKKYRQHKVMIEKYQNRSVEFVYRDSQLFTVGIPPKNFRQAFWQGLNEHIEHTGEKDK